MPIPDTSGVPPFADFDMLKNKLNEIVQKYNNLLVNMDSLNVVSLTADHIDAGTLDAGVVTVRADYNSGAYIEIGPTGMTIFDGAKNTFSVTIGGQVTMTGATVQSATGYPKVELLPANNLFRAATSTTQYVSMLASDPLFGGSPTFLLVDGSDFAGMVLSGELFIGGQTNIRIVPGGFFGKTFMDSDVQFEDFTRIINGATSGNLQSALNAKANAFSGYSGSFTVDGTTLSFSNGILTSVS